MKRHIPGLSGCLLVLFSLTTWTAEPMIELVDQTGNIVCVPQPVERLASVYGAGTFYVYTLGAADRLVMAWYIGIKGISHASAPMFRLEPRLEEILSFGDPNVEEMIAREAQLILVDASRHAAFADQMNDLGVPTLQFLVETPEALKGALRLLAPALGDEAVEQANAFLVDYDRVTTTVRDALSHLADEERVRVLFLGTDSLKVASGDMYQTRLIEAAGGASVSEGLTGYWNEVNLEQILLWNPDVILIPPYGAVQPSDILDHPDWQSIRAVRNERVHRMPRVIAPMDTPVPESLLGVIWMVDIFYPGKSPLDLAVEVNHFYTTYYGYTLSPEELAYLTGS